MYEITGQDKPYKYGPKVFPGHSDGLGPNNYSSHIIPLICSVRHQSRCQPISDYLFDLLKNKIDTIKNIFF
jgi:hypothetical protein